MLLTSYVNGKFLTSNLYIFCDYGNKKVDNYKYYEYFKILDTYKA